MNYDTIKLLNLEDIDIDLSKSFITKENNILNCTIVLNEQKLCCPKCMSINYISHGYYIKKITHSISTNSPCNLKYKARRYICKNCGNTFYENNPFCKKGDKVSLFTEIKVLEKLRSHTSTFSSVARDLNISIQSVVNIFDKYVLASRLPLSEVICIDEIYTNKLTRKKYSCVIFDFLNNKLIDIYPSRLKKDLFDRFMSIPLLERKKVKYVVIDMWETYFEVSTSVFPNCKVAVDSFHVITHLNTAMDLIRIKTMRKFDKGHSNLKQADMYYYMLKKFHYFFTKNFDNIYDGAIKVGKLNTKWDKLEIKKYLLSIDDDLRYSFELKERYMEFNKTAKYETCHEELDILIYDFLNSHLEEFVHFGNLLQHWRNEIINSFIIVNKQRLSNGKMESCNSRLKCIIKNANGYKNFSRFRNKCFFAINKDTPITDVSKKIKKDPNKKDHK